MALFVFNINLKDVIWLVVIAAIVLFYAALVIWCKISDAIDKKKKHNKDNE